MGVINLGAIVEKLRKKLSGDGFVTNTDYATSSTGGVIKADSTYGLGVTTGGKLKGTTISAEDYASANDGALISKGTLDGLSLGGSSIELVYQAPAEAPAFNSTPITIADNVENYKILFLGLSVENGGVTTHVVTAASFVANSGSAYVSIPDLGASASVTNATMVGGTKQISAGYVATTASTIKWDFIYGIK